MTYFTSDEFAEASAIVARHMAPTPQFVWPLLNESVGTEVWVKHENCTPTGAFKVRGGLVYIDRLVRERPEVQGVVSATRGNHGQSLAFAGRAAGLPITIVVPHGNSPDKNAAMRGFGAELIEHGVDFQAAREHLADVAAERGFEAVPSFHRDLCMGVATYAHELFSAAGELDVVYVPVGMGSGICGLMTIRDLLGLSTEIVGVVSDHAPATALSFDVGAPVSTDTVDTFIDGVATRVPDPVAIDLIVRGASRIVQISDDQCADALRLLLRCTHHLVEPSGAAALAGFIADRESRRDGVRAKRVGVIVSGGNIDARILSEILAGRTPAP
ncbi:MAG TPA: threonine dehydratase [Ilumatobacteraceae bacterium]